MKYYAQFYRRAVWPVGTAEVIEACGDRSIIRLDGRMTSRNMHAVSADDCKKRGYIGYTILRGERLLDAKPVTKYRDVTGLSALATISEVIAARTESRSRV